MLKKHFHLTVSGSRKDGITTVVYKRPLVTKDSSRDKVIPNPGQVSIIAAFGPLNSRHEANAHSITDKTTDDIKIDFSSMVRNFFIMFVPFCGFQHFFFESG